MSDSTPTPDTVPEVIDDPTSPDGEVDQLPYPDVDGIAPDDVDEDDDEESVLEQGLDEQEDQA